jgi:hypothetical protein
MARTIRDTAVLIGLSPESACVYSDLVPLGEYWDGEHAWDSSEQVRQLRMATLRGYLFDASGELIQEFESRFNLNTGVFSGGWTKHADGTYQEHSG